MHLLVLSLLAVGAFGHSVGYRTNLLAYAPSRGEFPVGSGLAQGYVRYLDATGAERLVAYNYPEPLFGLRRLSYGNENPSNPFLRNSINMPSNTKSNANQEQTMLFRAWCEQRYNALRAELEQLRATGKQPSANMLAQLEPLEKIIKEDAFDAIPSLSPEAQKARDEHLRIWNEVRLQVQRAEEAQLQITQPQQPEFILLKQSTQPALKSEQNLDQAKPVVSIDTRTSFSNSPQPVQETPEVLRARQEHLSQYNAILQRQPSNSEAATLKAIPGIKQPAQPVQAARPVQPITPFLKTLSPNPESQQSPQPIEETPEVKRAREEHLKYYNEAILRQGVAVEPLPNQPTSFASLSLPIAVKSTFNTPDQQQATPLQETPEVKQAREEHLAALNQAKIRAEDKLADIDDMIRYEERERDAERLRELELRREQDKLAELEQQREKDRLKEETRLREAERISLQQQEQLRIENERYAEEQRLKAEQLEMQKLKAAENYEDTKKATETTPDNAFKLLAQAAQPVQQQQQLQQNGFFLRIQTNEPSAIKAVDAAGLSTTGEQQQNPFLLRHTELQAITRPAALPLTSSPALPQPLKAAAAQTSNDQSELDKATREHFRAHEIALEQLRLANLKNPWNPDCN